MAEQVALGLRLLVQDFMSRPLMFLVARVADVEFDGVPSEAAHNQMK